MNMIKQTYRDALRDGMSEEMRRDAEVFLMGEEVAEYQGAYKCSAGMLEEFGPKRVIDSPITELGFTGLGVGAAFMGMRPIIEYMSWSFALLSSDQIINSAAKTYYMSGGKVGCPIVFRGINGLGKMVAAQHSHDYTNMYANCPGLKVVCPVTPADAKGLIKSAVRDNAPVLVMENERLYGMEGDVPEGDDVLVEIGKARLVREGKDITLIGYSMSALQCEKAAEMLAKEGVDAEVIDLRSIRPLDKSAIVKSIQKTNRAIVVEEGYSFAGIAAEIMAVISEEAFDALDAPVERMSLKDIPIPYADHLEQASIVQADDIVKKAVQICK
ncbi:MAG: pyruvate dehydrogenase complex E1 component subunit beta [Magnetococcales bacterium]|nr:pyruvate dehydrogenase complex E1 component subunit beta [Magnetococcales bacterium]PPR19494.1 MAG: 2-oxoisovalerate dehydrogenase subunit beta [Pseudomonadota bacterium]